MARYIAREIVIKEDVRIEDSGQAIIVDVEGKHPRLWVQIKSWDEEKLHPELKDIVGKTVTVTIKIED